MSTTLDLPAPDFRALFESAPGLYLVLTPDLRILAVSDAYLRATMTQRAEILGRHLFDVFPDNPDDPAATGVRNLSASLNHVLQFRVPDAMAVQKYDIRRPLSEGGAFEERYWSPLNSPVLGADGNVVYIIHCVDDMTELIRLEQQGAEQREANEELRAERRQAEGRLLESDERFRLLVDRVKDYAIFLLDPQGRLASWNIGAERIHGYRAEEIVGKHFSCFFSAEAAAQGRPDRELEVAQTDGRFEDEGWRVRKDGSRFWANVVLTALWDEAGGLKGFSKITRDLSEHKRAEDALRQAHEELERRVQERTAELARANQALRESEERLAAELEATTRLHALSTRLLVAADLTMALDDVLQEAILVTRSDFGNIQLYNPQSQALEIVAQRGFWQDFLDHFRTVRVDEGSCCAQAMISGQRMVIEDVELDSSYERHRQIAAAAGYRGVQSTPLMSRSGNVLGMLSTHFRRPHRPSERDERLLDLHARHAADLIERLRFEEALRESEAKFRLLADTIPQLAWTARPDGHSFWYNRRWYEYTGTTPEQMEGWGWQSVHDPNELPKVLERWKGSIATGEPFDMVFPLRGADDVFRPFLTRIMPLKDDSGRVLQWFGTNTDITEQRRMEEALRRAHDELEQRVRARTADLAAANAALQARARQQAAVAEFGQRALAGADRTALTNGATAFAAQALGVEYGRVMELLPDGARLLLRGGVGWKDGRLGSATVGTGRASVSGFTLLVNEAVVCADWQAERRFRPPQLLADHGVVSSMTVVIPGAERPYGVLAVDSTRQRQFTDDDKHFLQAVANVLATALERKQAEERAEAFAAELQRSNRELEQFASIASHDLQEPLRKIRAFGDRLQARFAEPLGEQGRQYIERMQASATRMQTLIEDLLTFSRVTSEARPFTEVDLATEARHVVSDLESRIHQTGGRVEVGDLPTVQADATQLRQLFQNLIGNALKFHKPGEPPLVKVGAEMFPEAGAGVPRAGPNARVCRITIQDNGIGFEEAYLDRIFKVFQRLHSRHEYEGTGVGLAICRKIVERHGGTITARSAPGHGATFIVTLPVRQPKQGKHHE
jgi:PAS domain S-box-containing protein